MTIAKRKIKSSAGLRAVLISILFLLSVSLANATLEVFGNWVGVRDYIYYTHFFSKEGLSGVASDKLRLGKALNMSLGCVLELSKDIATLQEARKQNPEIDPYALLKDEQALKAFYILDKLINTDPAVTTKEHLKKLENSALFSYDKEGALKLSSELNKIEQAVTSFKAVKTIIGKQKQGYKVVLAKKDKERIEKMQEKMEEIAALLDKNIKTPGADISFKITNPHGIRPVNEAAWQGWYNWQEPKSKGSVIFVIPGNLSENNDKGYNNTKNSPLIAATSAGAKLFEKFTNETRLVQQKLSNVSQFSGKIGVSNSDKLKIAVQSLNQLTSPSSMTTTEKTLKILDVRTTVERLIKETDDCNINKALKNAIKKLDKLNTLNKKLSQAIKTGGASLGQKVLPYAAKGGTSAISAIFAPYFCVQSWAYTNGLISDGGYGGRI